MRASRSHVKDPVASKVIDTLMKDRANTLPNMKGIYVLTPTGRLLAPSVGPHEDEIIAMLGKGMAQWKTLGKSERQLSREPARPSTEPYPAGGLILQVFSRDLPRDGGTGGGGGNQDFAWFQKGEVRTMVPAPHTPGTSQPIPEKLVQRLARHHLVDNVRGLRGEGIQTGKADVKTARLTAVVTKVEKDLVYLRLEGNTRTEYAVTKPGDRGYDAELLGRACYDPKREEFTSFELVAVGTRWGERPARKGGPEEAPLGFAFRLVPPADWASLAPPVQYRRGGYFD